MSSNHAGNHERQSLWQAFAQGFKHGPKLVFAPIRGAIKGAQDEFRRELKRTHN